MPRIGKMINRMMLQQPKVVGGVQTWVNLVAIWAQIDPTTGLEVAHADDKPTNTVNTIVWIRYRPEVRPRMRLAYESRLLEINTVINDQEKKGFMRLYCREVTS